MPPLLKLHPCAIALSLPLTATLLSVLSLGSFISTGRLHADERLKGIACRSVHLAFPGDNANAFYNEVTVQESAPGTYFMVSGWNTGYFGIQELANGKKLVLFSVWDNAQGDNPNEVKKEERVELLFKDPGVRVGRFGGEGTGGQSFYDFDWQIGSTYRFLVAAKPQDQRTEYSGYFFDPEKDRWIKLVTFSTPTGGQKMRGFYSFVEDFKRDRKSTLVTRRATFGNTWMRKAQSAWTPITSARFTADANPVLNIDSGPVEGRFFLATGGDITNQGTPLRESAQVEAAALTTPNDLPPEVH